MRSSIPLPARLLALAAAALVVSGTSRCRPAEPEQVVLPLDAFRVDVPSAGPATDLDREVVVYAGPRVRDFSLALSVSNLAGAARVEVRDGRDSLLQTITANGETVTAAFGGNVGRLRVRLPGVANLVPDVRVLRMITTRVERFVHPAVAEPIANSVTAFPLTVGQPVDFALHDSRTDDFFFSVGGLAGREFDLILTGAATLDVEDPLVGGFPEQSRGTLASFSPARDAASRFPGLVLARFPATSRDSLLITVSNRGIQRMNGLRDPFRARIVVAVAGPVQQLSFPSRQPPHFFGFPIGMDGDGGATAPPAPVPALQCTNYGGAAPVPASPLAGLPGLVCYNGHTGTDFLIAPPAVELNVPVNAAASGIVVDVATGNVDTCGYDPFAGAVTCPGTAALAANFVTVRQDDGRFARYYHLRNQPLPVAPGDRVACGEFLGNVGSSGMSATPHLHFELRSLAAAAAPAATGIDALIGTSGTAIDPYPAAWAGRVAEMPLLTC